MTFETFDQSDEETWPDKDKDNDKDNDKDKDSVTVKTLITFLTIENRNLNIQSYPWIKSDRDSIRNSCDVFFFSSNHIIHPSSLTLLCSHQQWTQRHQLESSMTQCTRKRTLMIQWEIKTNEIEPLWQNVQEEEHLWFNRWLEQIIEDPLQLCDTM